MFVPLKRNGLSEISLPAVSKNCSIPPNKVADSCLRFFELPCTRMSLQRELTDKILHDKVRILTMTI